MQSIWSRRRIVEIVYWILVFGWILYNCFGVPINARSTLLFLLWLLLLLLSHSVVRLMSKNVRSSLLNRIFSSTTAVHTRCIVCGTLDWVNVCVFICVCLLAVTVPNVHHKIPAVAMIENFDGWMPVRKTNNSLLHTPVLSI